MFIRIITVAIFLSLTLLGCIDAKRLRKSFDINKRYEGWYIATAKAHFFVTQKDFFDAKNIAFNLPQHSLSFPAVPDSFFYHDCKSPENAKQYFLIGKHDSSFGEKVAICRASAFYRGIAKENESYPGNIYKIKCSDGKVVIKGIWYEHFVDLHDITLYSNCNSDSIKYH
jgi:hypothetical protein